MKIVDWFSKVSDGSKKLFKENAQIVNSYNYNTFVCFALIAMCVFFILSILSFIPLLKVVYSNKFRILFLSYFFITLIFHILSGFPKGLAEKHSTAFLYSFLLFMQTFGIILNLFSIVTIPYTITLGFLLLHPLLLLDTRIKNILTNIIVCVSALIVSFVFKPRQYFCMDAINCATFAFLGVILGDLSRYNQIRYMEMKSRELDMALSIEKARNEAKSSFIANMSHEIRTPINAILGLNEMIMRETSENQILDYASSVKIAGRTLLSLVNDILDYSKIEANKLQIICAEYCLDSAINDLVSMILPKAKEKELEFDVQIDKTIPNTLFGDEIRLKQCILNLLTNAVKYTNKGTITLKITWKSISKNNMLLNVSVSDTGIGIKQENIPALFTAFDRIDEKQHRNIEGTGLGLTIIVSLLEKMNSSLDLKTEWGKGSTFSFKLQQEIIDDEPIGDYEERFRNARNQSKSYTEMFHAPNARILVIDDMRINLEVIRGLLKSTQIQVDTAQSGEEALQMVALTHYDIIFIDHRMPEMDGVETFNAINNLKTNKSVGVPCIALTANAVPGAKESYLKLGFVDYVSKPIDYVQLEELLIELLPKEKVQIVPPDVVERSKKVLSEFMQNYRQIEGIDSAAALANCGDEEVLQIAVSEYYATITRKADDLERFMNSGDLRNYTVLVHAIKSSSRLIGALGLSKMAARLEECGDAENLEEILRDTPTLLKLYRGYKERLKPVAPPEKPPLSDAEFADAKVAIKEYAATDDFNSILSIVTFLEQYQLSAEQESLFGKLQNCVKLQDTSLIADIL